jgi:DNA-binding transcriptional regulator of glucitol operon
VDNKLKKGLPFIAVIGATVALVSLIALSLLWQTSLNDTGETRRSVEASLKPALASQPSSIDDATFQEAVSRLEDVPYVATIWLFTPDGRILQGNSAFSQGTVEASATDETHRVLDALPDSALSAEQRTALLAASVMQAEGEHNDVYRHMLRDVRGPGGDVIAFVGATYDVSPAISARPGVVWVLLLAGTLLGMGAYWLSLPVWVWLDARMRGERAWVWATFVLLGNLVALITYILARRPSSTYGDRRNPRTAA